MASTLVRALALAAAAVAANCSDDTVVTEPSAIEDMEWWLASIQEDLNPLISIQDPSRYTLRLTDDGVLVRADCNRCFGRYTVGSGSIDIRSLGCTRVACPADSHGDRYVNSLEAVSAFEVRDGQLILRGPNVTLRFRP